MTHDRINNESRITGMIKRSRWRQAISEYDDVSSLLSIGPHKFDQKIIVFFFVLFTQNDA